MPQAKRGIHTDTLIAIAILGVAAGIGYTLRSKVSQLFPAIMLPIEPGVRLSSVSLGMTELQVTSVLGMPRETQDPGQVSWNLTFRDPATGADLIVGFYHVRGRNSLGDVFRISTQSNLYRTSQGLGVSSLKDSVRSVMAPPRDDVSDEKGSILYYPGIWFGVAGSRVSAVVILPSAVGSALIPYILERAAKDKGLPDFRTVIDPQQRMSYIAELLRPKR
jgi:hypothetical protein